MISGVVEVSTSTSATTTSCRCGNAATVFEASTTPAGAGGVEPSCSGFPPDLPAEPRAVVAATATTAVLVSLMKGVELGTLKRMSEVIGEVTDAVDVGEDGGGEDGGHRQGERRAQLHQGPASSSSSTPRSGAPGLRHGELLARPPPARLLVPGLLDPSERRRVHRQRGGSGRRRPRRRLPPASTIGTQMPPNPG